ncbi:uncharacterized protein LOC110858080 isoform X2 [Folsomia candida]|uniref:Structural maintenance of chromosomes protein 6 n=1 Tax=Folsomia candida TaxID=158441 RepID=A0A226DFD8_FOLCA|nr:uncharacterized protein LOC110858080 isoform X2 [Folsomia candida]OXA43913.1 Structural maintenance of chromosomes protein 6 [Folsomia candida]
MDIFAAHICCTPSCDKKICAARKFKYLGRQISELVGERQHLNIKIDVISKDLARLEDGDRLTNLLLSQDPALAFLNLDLDLDPEKVKAQMALFKVMVAEHKDKFENGVPIGPFFSSFTVKGDLWCNLIEKILSPYLFTFVVDSFKDRVTLSELFAEFRGPVDSGVWYAQAATNIRIVIVPFSETYTPPERPPLMDKFTLNCTYLLETLKFNEESEANLWKSAIGNKSNMENIYLFQNEHDAFIFMHAQSSRPPTSKALAYSLDGYKIFPFPEFKTAAIRIPKQASFLEVDRGGDITFLKATLDDLIETRKLYDLAINEARDLQLAALDDLEFLKQLDRKNRTRKQAADQNITHCSQKEGVDIAAENTFQTTYL